MKHYKLLIVSLILAFLILIFYNASVAIEQTYEVDGDAYDYIHLGLSLAKTGKYGHFKKSREELLFDFQSGNIKSKNYEFGNKTAFRPPVWPIIISGIFILFGYNLTYIIIFKFLIHFSGIYIFFRTIKLFDINNLLIISGTFLYAISPAWQLYSRVFLSEPITLFLITIWVYYLIRCTKEKSNYWSQAIVAGIIILCHPYYIFLPFSVWLILFIKKEFSLKQFLSAAIICGAVVSIWIIRNSIVFDTQEIVITTSSGAVIAKGWNNDVPYKHTNTKGDLADETLVLNEYDYEDRHLSDEVDRMKLYKDASIHFIRTNPQSILPIVGVKLRSAFNPFPETARPGFLETGRYIFQFLALLALIYILIFIKNRIIYSLAIGLILSTIGITIITYSGFRFRMPQTGLELLFIIFLINHLILKINKPR